MRKWKRDYLSMNNMTVWKKDDGMTLIELMASLAILSVVILLVGSVHIFGQRQFINQTESASQANDLTYSLAVMSRDLRKVEATTVSIENGTLFIEGGPEFSHSEPNLMKNTTVLSNKIKSFIPVINEDNSITITLIGKGNQQNQSNKYQTTIYFRR